MKNAKNELMVYHSEAQNFVGISSIITCAFSFLRVVSIVSYSRSTFFPFNCYFHVFIFVSNLRERLGRWGGFNNNPVI